MAGNKRISELGLLATFDVLDELIGVDKSDLAMGATGTTKRFPYSTVRDAIIAAHVAGDPHPGYLTDVEGAPARTTAIGVFYEPEGTAGSAAAMTLSQLTAGPINLPAGTYDALQFNCTTAGAAGSTVRLGIYTDANGLPGARVVDAGTVDTTTTGLKVATISQVLAAGRYWLVNVAQGGTAPSCTVLSGNPNLYLGATANLLGGIISTVAGALPASLSAMGTVSTARLATSIRRSA